MKRHTWLAIAAAAGLGFFLGCSSNPYRPTFFQRHRDKSVGPELGVPSMDGSYMGNEMGTAYPAGAPITYPQGGMPPMGPIAPPAGAPNTPIPSFPQNTVPQGPPPVPQGPQPRQQQPTTPTTRSS